MHGGFRVQQLLLPGQGPGIIGKLLQLFRVLLQLLAVCGKLYQGALQVGNIGSGKLYIPCPVPIGDLRFFKPPHGFVRKPIGVVYIRDPHNAPSRGRQRLLDLAQILHIAVKQESAQLIHLPVAQDDAARSVKKTHACGKPVKAFLDGIKAQVSYSKHRSRLLSLCAQATSRPPAEPSHPEKPKRTARQHTPPTDPSRRRTRK